MKKERIVVAMSGGVDSSVAAALLKAEGHEVIGVTMCLSLPEAQSKKLRCCGLEGIESARLVAQKLGIRHYVLNLGPLFNKRVVEDFCREYSLGRTPNPCVLCNQYIKFGALLKHAAILNARCLATGHYASIARQGRTYFLKKAKDITKDQSYFLYRLGQEQLKNILFPLGAFTKEEVRGIASKYGLPTATRKESQEICFVPQDYRGFLAVRLKNIRPGDIADQEGRILGRHKGVAYYTIGQRQGLGIAGGRPLYITHIDARSNRVIVGGRNDAIKSEFLVTKAFFSAGPLPKKKVAATVKIRYNHKESLASIIPCGNKLKVRFVEPQFAVTPGQSAVFYHRQKVLGGGIIDKVLS